MKQLFLCLSLFISTTAFSQNLKYCGTAEKEKEQLAAHPEILIEEDKLNQFVQDWIASHPPFLREETMYVIPIVFHIIHDYGYENITDDQVRDAVRILNEDYEKRNADTSVVVNTFKNLIGNVKVEFRLANKTSTGVCTNGIVHIHSLQTYVGTDESKLDDWPRDKYLNVWTVKMMEDGVAGYAYLPYTAAMSGNAPFDGVIILSSYVGSIGSGSVSTSRALTHEIGHMLGLLHPWGDTNEPGVSCGDDNIDDTPETTGWTTCNLNGSVCNPPIIENVQNFMDYSYCSKMFTIDQATKMEAVLNATTASRNNLWKSANLTATGTSDTTEPLCTPQADFYSNYKMACTGSTVTFHDVSWSGEETSRSWTFQDGNPATSTNEIPTVSFSSPGWKTVSLTATNSAGSSVASRSAYIYISSSADAQYGPGYFEHFENASTFTNDWIVMNFEGNSSLWKRIGTTGYESASCVELNNYNNSDGDIDALITPSFDFSAGGPMYLDFRYSCGTHTTVSANVNDGLYIYSSTNCGATWTLRNAIKTTELANAGYFSGSFTPSNSSQWASRSILITSSLYQPNVRFKFEYKTNSKGNNIYLDNIQIGTNPVGINDPNAASFHLSVQPNPLTESSVIVLNQQMSGNMSLRIVDIMGRTLKMLNSGWLSEGEHRFEVNVNDFNGAGMYFLVADDGVTISREKIVVQ